MIFGIKYELFLSLYQITFFLAFDQAKPFFQPAHFNERTYVLFCDKL